GAQGALGRLGRRAVRPRCDRAAQAAARPPAQAPAAGGRERVTVCGRPVRTGDPGARPRRRGRAPRTAGGSTMTVEPREIRTGRVPADDDRTLPGATTLPATRSEEHTSELQSRENLVCRLLLE